MGLFFTGPRPPRSPGTSSRGGRPARPAVGAGHPPGFPLADGVADLEEQVHRAAGRGEQHRVPVGAWADLGHLEGWRPSSAVAARQPDAHVRVPFLRPAEPRRQEHAPRQLHQRGGVALRERLAVAEDVLGDLHVPRARADIRLEGRFRHFKLGAPNALKETVPIAVPRFGQRLVLEKTLHAPDRNRTCNLRFRRPLLSPLSYGRPESGEGHSRTLPHHRQDAPAP